MLESVLVCGLVTFALLAMIMDLEGPFDIFLKVRIFFTELINNETRPTSHFRSDFIHKLYECSFCMGTWISAGVSSLLVLSMKQPISYIPFVWLGGLSVACLLYREI